jgi:hypothetical protein
MACQSCQQARQAAGSAIRAVVTLKPNEARQQAAVAIQAVGDKATEALRVRGLLRR